MPPAGSSRHLLLGSSPWYLLSSPMLCWLEPWRWSSSMQNTLMWPRPLRRSSAPFHRLSPFGSA
eukprot:9070647-Alexandrium_andersonii.AAC.1